jgi:hypothetical protein
MHKGVWSENTKRKDHLDYIRLDLRETRWKAIDWIHLAEERAQWRTLMNTVINHRVP